MMNNYLVSMLIGTVFIFMLYALRCAYAKRESALRQKAWLSAFSAMTFAIIFGIVFARVSYAVLMQELDFEYDGIAALEQLLEFEIDNLSFFGGAVGVCVGVFISNLLIDKKTALLKMDAFAPFGALLVALFRMGEGFWGSYGTGNMLAEDSPFAFFPLALEIHVDGGYSYWGWAMFFFSAFFALLWAIISFFALRKHGRTGLNFTLTLFFLALPQILFESMRKRGLFWLFVHTEQALCAIVLLALVLYWTLKTNAPLAPATRWFPAIAIVLGIGLLVATEFAIDGKLFDLPHEICYSFMGAVLAFMGTAGSIAAKRWNMQA